MAAARLQQLAREAFLNKALVALPFRGGAPELFRLSPDPSPAGLIEAPRRQEIVDRCWAETEGKYFDGSLIGVTGLRCGPHELEGSYALIRYRDYLAADQVLADPAGIATPLAIGVHCLLRRGGEAAILRDREGRALVPGGAVDASALVGGAVSIERAIRAEIEEEAGYANGSDRLVLTRIFIGGNPTHIVCALAMEIEDEADWRALCHSGHRAEAEGIVGVEPVPLARLTEAKDRLPWMTRTALEALAAWQRDADVTAD